MEDTDGGLHPAVDGQSLDEDEDRSVTTSVRFEITVPAVTT